MAENQTELNFSNPIKEAFFREYLSAWKPFISLAKLEVFAEEAKEKKTVDFCLNKAYENSIHPNLHDKILFYLYDKKTPHERGKHLK